MNWQHTPYVIPLVIAAAITIALAVSAWQRRPAPGASAFVWLMLAVAEWSLAYALRLASADLEGKLFWAKVRYLGIVIVPTAWLVFALQQTGRERWLTRCNLALLAIEPLSTLLLVWTNDWHRLYWRSISLNEEGSFVTFSSTHGVVFWGHAAYSYLLLLLGTFLLIQSLVRSPRLYRGQAIAMLVGALAPLVGDIVSTLGSSPFPHLDLTPFAFTLTGLAMTWGLFRFRLLDIVPVARDAVIESMRDGVIVLDAQNRIVDLNPAGQSILDCTASDAIGQPARQILSERPDLVERYRDVTEAHAEVSVGEGEVQRTFDLRISPVRDGRGRLTGRLIVLRDVTERKRAEEELHRAKEAAEATNRAKSEFVSLVSHELRIPMSVILGNAGMLASGIVGPVNEAQSEALGVIESNVKRMTALVSDLTDISRIESGNLYLRFEAVPIAEIVQEVARVTRKQIEEKEQALTLEVPQDLPLVWGDRIRLAQIFINLVNNAHKFTPPHGRITVRAEHTTERQGPGGNWEFVHLAVEDDGVGIEPADQAKIFQKFFRSEEVREVPGTGLGLSIAKNLVELQGGRIWFESEPCQGTTFHFTVPVAETQ
jgi:PAS domain S-box-containing protein